MYIYIYGEDEKLKELLLRKILKIVVYCYKELTALWYKCLCEAFHYIFGGCFN